jgi:hypothetical protein
MGTVAFLSGWNMDAAALLRPKLVDNGQGGSDCDLLADPGFHIWFRTSPPLAGSPSSPRKISL